MIELVKRNQLNEEKYNSCIASSLQSRIFGYSWYLDIVADDWDILVLNDYEAVMPIPWRKKSIIKYAYPPFWLLELGVFSKDEIVNSAFFLKELFKHFKFVELRLNTNNRVEDFKKYKFKKEMQHISLKESYEAIYLNYNRNRKRELKKAEECCLIENWNDNPIQLVDLFKSNVGKRVEKIQDNDYQVLLDLMNTCLEKNVGELLTIYDKDSKLVGAAFFLKHKETITMLVCSTDFNNRDNGANTFLNDRAIFKYQKTFSTFHFGGSSMKSISNYYKSFGASTKDYFLLKKRLL